MFVNTDCGCSSQIPKAAAILLPSQAEVWSSIYWNHFGAHSQWREISKGQSLKKKPKKPRFLVDDWCLRLSTKLPAKKNWNWSELPGRISVSCKFSPSRMMPIVKVLRVFFRISGKKTATETLNPWLTFYSTGLVKRDPHNVLIYSNPYITGHNPWYNPTNQGFDAVLISGGDDCTLGGVSHPMVFMVLFFC